MKNQFSRSKNTFKAFFDSIKKQFDDAFTQQSRSHSKKFKRKAWPLILLLTLVLAFLYFFFFLPSLSPMSYELYIFIVGILLLFWALMLVFGKKPKTYIGLKFSLIFAAFCILFPAVMTFIGSPLFQAKAYSQILPVKEGVFEDEIEQVQLKQVPVVDREAAVVIGEKEMGAVGDLVSQFDIDPIYSQVNLAGKPIRVSPLEYNDVFKYLWNFKNGIEYYVSVDMTTQAGDLNKLNEAIFYSESDYLLRDLDRHLRFQYPFWLLGETNFEIDDNGKAFYITPKLKNRIAMFSATDGDGVIITDAHTGESQYYAPDRIPEWVDRAVPSEVVLEQLNWHGQYQMGFFNTIFGQRNVRTNTEGYNYISLGTDIYLITGVTSVRSDTSNLGFYYVNLRTKESAFYPQPSATELAAMQSAMGKVQEKNYEPTFPVILNIQDRPVYFMSLKDQSRTAKMFALVDAEQFTNVSVGNTVQEAMTQYYESNPNTGDVDIQEGLLEEFTIAKIVPLVEEGNSIYYFQNENERILRADPEMLGPNIAFLEAGDTIRVITQKGDAYDLIAYIEY